MKKKKQVEGPLHSKFCKDERLLFYKKRFYAEDKDFHFFESLTSEQIEIIGQTLEQSFPDSQYPQNSLIRYLAILDYLMDSKRNHNFKSFDEKIAFLIQGIDPSLSIYYQLLTIGYSSSNPSNMGREQALTIIHFIEGFVGTFDPQFLKYEEIYFRKVLKEGKVLSHIKREGHKALLDSFKGIPSFDNVKDIEFSRLSRKADYYATVCDNPKDIHILCFNICNPNSVLELFDIASKAIFFILVIDPELKALKTYVEESNIAQMRERMMGELGFYHEGLIRLEELYRKRFFPEMTISEWSY